MSTDVTCLGVVLDNEIKFCDHVKRLYGRCFYNLRQLRTIRRAVITGAVKQLVNAFIVRRVDYCNSVFVPSAAVHLRPLQSVLNAAARLMVRKQMYDHITPAMRDEPRWLPVPQRLEYRLPVQMPPPDGFILSNKNMYSS